MYFYLTIYTRVSRRYSIFFYPPRRYFNPFYPASSSRRKLLAFFYTSVRGIKEVYLFFFYNYIIYPRKGLIVITINTSENSLTYTIKPTNSYIIKKKKEILLKYLLKTRLINILILIVLSYTISYKLY
ncbi:uncharacterized protein LY79DRAFT_585568 [Colletotrichum navitas]|uniref:Uncharacterized protein n=1 Tax=Colletotrichum navitas TaxID=681940 RepID=A0AAD8UWH3_9PEZI|nr:uncharacterized protein LY79DRAFT_585568 [Colletotrichum navitas]KAK1561378.1 hypothetical protein LY79DRAFT_585568 [Colletotrichum navitas]